MSCFSSKLNLFKVESRIVNDDRGALICCKPHGRSVQEGKGIIIYYSLTYREWSEDTQKELRSLTRESVSGDELFLRKLVDATRLHDKLWSHISNESEEHTDHSVYVTEFTGERAKPYGASITDLVLASEGGYTSTYSAMYWIWHEPAFRSMEQREGSVFTLELAQRLLDHYTVLSGKTYEFIYSVLDPQLKKVHLFVKEVDL